MPTLWTYPWSLHREGIDGACERLARYGVDGVNVASHYHSVRSMQPRFPDDLFRAYDGGCYFDPDGEFDDTPITPSANSVGSWDDPLAAIVDGVHDHGLAVNAWTVCLHNTRLGATNPGYRIQSAFGDAHDHSLCPSRPEVRDYFAAVVGSITDRDVDEIQLESIGFPSVFHAHGSGFGHDKRQVATTDTETLLHSQCFCEGCRAASESYPLKFDATRRRVRELLRRSLADPTVSTPPPDDLLDAEPLLEDLLDFRAAVVERLLERLAGAAGSTPLNYYVEEAYGSTPSELSLSGVQTEALETHLDRVTALCYVADPDLARERIAALERAVGLPVDAGLTLDPAVVDRRERLEGLVSAVRSVTDGTIALYHHSLASETRLEWLAEVFA
jgi:hypothetical protein